MCKVDKVFDTSSAFPKSYRRRKLVPVLVALHFQELPQIVQLVNPRALDNGKRHVKGLLLGVGKSIDEKILWVVCGNADASHGFVKLLFGGGHGKPVATRFSRFKAGAAVNQDCKLFRFLSRLGSRCSGGNVGGGLLDFLALYGVAR